MGEATTNTLKSPVGLAPPLQKVTFHVLAPGAPGAAAARFRTSPLYPSGLKLLAPPVYQSTLISLAVEIPDSATTRTAIKSNRKFADFISISSLDLFLRS